MKETRERGREGVQFNQTSKGSREVNKIAASVSTLQMGIVVSNTSINLLLPNWITDSRRCVIGCWDTAFVQRRSYEMDSSVVVDDHVNNSTTSSVSKSDLFLFNHTANAVGGLFVVDQSTNEIVLKATNNAEVQSRCCKLTEGVYTLMGCISVTLFFLGVATIKFLR